MSLAELHANVKVRIIVDFLTGTAMMMVIPFLAIYFSQRVGQTVTGFLFVCVITYLADIAPDNARSSYMAMSGMSQLSSMIVAGLMISLGAFLSSSMMTVIILAFGVLASLCFYRSGRLMNRRLSPNANHRTLQAPEL